MKNLTNRDQYIISHVKTFIGAVQHLNPDNLYKAEVLCCQFWHIENASKHSPTGKRLYQLAITGYLPLEPIGKDSDRAMLYRLK